MPEIVKGAELPELRVGVVFAHGKDFTAGLDLANVGPAVAAGTQPAAAA